MLSIPYLTQAGVVTLRFRRLGDTGPKYRSMTGDEPRLYNTAAMFRREPYIAICEGEIDTITADEAGIPAVGVQGSSAWQPYFWRCFRGYSRVFILADSDPVNEKSGKRAGEQLVAAVTAQIREAVTIRFPEGDDVNSFTVREGKDALRQLLKLDQLAAKAG